MVDPVLALLVFTALVAAGAAAFWPRRGIVARIRRITRFTERILLEDALKHVYTCASVGRDCTLESLAGQLGVSTGRAAGLLAALAERELVRSGASGPVLTDVGRESALRLVRAHRLWERYLADRTGVPPGEWHAEAERMEHALTVEETERLASRLGHPSWDPHGDPIPTPGGEVPDVEGLNLAGLEPGETAEVVHMEDEPHEVYDALLADGFTLGMRLEVVGRSARAVEVRSSLGEQTVSALAARNVTVRVLEGGERVDGPVETLRDLAPGEAGVVTDISPACRGSQRRRLLDMGVVKGTRIVAEFASASGDPVAYRVRGALVALRGEQASWIRIRRVAAGDAQPTEDAQTAGDAASAGDPVEARTA